MVPNRAKHHNYNTVVLYFVCFIVLASFICGNVELNAAPKNTKPCYNFSLIRWNRRSLPAHNLSKS